MELLKLVLTPAEWREKIAAEIGDVPRNHVFELRIPISVSSGAWRFVVNGSSTGPIPYNASGDAVALAIGLLDTVGEGNVQGSGPRKGPHTLEFTGEMGGLDLRGIVSTTSNLEPDAPVTVHTLQVGQRTQYTADILKLWNGLGDETPEGIAKSPFASRYAFIKFEVGKKRLGYLMGRVDTKDRDYEQKRSQEVAELRRVIQDAQNEMARLASALDTNGGNSALSGRIKKRTGSGLGYGQVEIGGVVYGRR